MIEDTTDPVDDLIPPALCQGCGVQGAEYMAPYVECSECRDFRYRESSSRHLDGMGENFDEGNLLSSIVHAIDFIQLCIERMTDGERAAVGRRILGEFKEHIK